MSRNKIEPGIILTLCTDGILTIPLIITDRGGRILHMSNTTKHSATYYHTRKHLIETMKTLIEEYKVDTILLEQNKLFIDGIDRYPDPYVLRNVLLGFSIQTSIEDNFYEKVQYIFEIPEYDWKTKVLNKKTKYAIDLYKAHTLLRQFNEEELQEIDKNNYYKAICFSESILYDALINKKYLVNEGD